MVGHVEAIEARLKIFTELSYKDVWVEPNASFFHIGNLPQAGNNATDVETGSELDAVRLCTHRRYSRPLEDSKLFSAWLLGRSIADLGFDRVDISGCHLADGHHLAVLNSPQTEWACDIAILVKGYRTDHAFIFDRLAFLDEL